MASINITCTGVPNTAIVPDYELPFSYSNMFKAESPINFAINLTYLNELRTAVSASQITSTQISDGTKVLMVFLSGSINGSNNFINVYSTKTYTLNASNLNNNFLSQDLSLSGATFDICNYDLGLLMTQSEILAAHKKYKLIFRITDKNSPNANTSVQNGDIVQDFYLMLQTEHHGPYEVQFECVDTTDPNYFNNSELIDIATNMFIMIGGETQRVFYPKNISDLNPLPIYIINSGTEQDSLMYDFYGSMLASYGYFVIMPTDISSDVDSAQTMYYLKVYFNKIAGGKFANKLDFHQMFSSGHSLGGGRCSYLLNSLVNDFTTSPVVPDISVSDFKGIVYLEPASGYTDVQNNKFAQFLPCTICSDANSYGGPELVRPYRTDNENYIGLCGKIREGQHDDIANSIKGTNWGIDSLNFILPSLGGVRILAMNHLNQRSYNSKIASLNFLTECVVLYCACQHDPDVLNYLYNTNNSYLSSFDRNKKNYIDIWYNIPKSKINFIEDFSTSSNFTNNNILNGQIVGKDFFDELYNTYAFLQSQMLENEYPSLYVGYSPFYRDITQTLGYSGVVNAVTYPNKTYLFELGSSNSFLNFDKSSSPINLTSYKFISVLAAVAEKVINHTVPEKSSWERSLPFSLNEHFGLELTDVSNNVCMLSTHQNNRGIYINSGPTYISIADGYTEGRSKQWVTSKYINFRITDFKNKNSSIDMTQIKNIKILFDSSVGTNKGYRGGICLNGILTIS